MVNYQKGETITFTDHFSLAKREEKQAWEQARFYITATKNEAIAWITVFLFCASSCPCFNTSFFSWKRNIKQTQRLFCELFLINQSKYSLKAPVRADKLAQAETSFEGVVATVPYACFMARLHGRGWFALTLISLKTRFKNHLQCWNVFALTEFSSFHQ